MDLVRGLAVLLVILWHAGSVPAAQGWTQRPDLFVQLNVAISPFRLPVLAFVTGLLMPRAVAKPVWRFLTGKARGLLWPWAIWTSVMLALLGPPEITWRQVIHANHMWYLSVLILCYGLALLTRRIPPAFTAALLLGACLTFELETPVFERTLWFGSFLFLGWALAAHLHLWQRMRILVTAPVLALAAGYAWWCGHQGYAIGAGISTWLWTLLPIAAVVWLAPRVPASRARDAFTWVGRHSVVFYVVHFPVQVLTHRVLDGAGIDSAAAVITICMAAGVLVPWALTQVPAARWSWELPTPATVRRDAPPVASRMAA